MCLECAVSFRIKRASAFLGLFNSQGDRAWMEEDGEYHLTFYLIEGGKTLAN